jgi:hypothetical protein
MGSSSSKLLTSTTEQIDKGKKRQLQSHSLEVIHLHEADLALEPIRRSSGNVIDTPVVLENASCSQRQSTPKKWTNKRQKIPHMKENVSVKRQVSRGNSDGEKTSFSSSDHSSEPYPIDILAADIQSPSSSRFSPYKNLIVKSIPTKIFPSLNTEGRKQLLQTHDFTLPFELSGAKLTRVAEVIELMFGNIKCTAREIYLEENGIRFMDLAVKDHSLFRCHPPKNFFTTFRAVDRLLIGRDSENNVHFLILVETNVSKRAITSLGIPRHLRNEKAKGSLVFNPDYASGSEENESKKRYITMIMKDFAEDDLTQSIQEWRSSKEIYSVEQWDREHVDDIIEIGRCAKKSYLKARNLFDTRNRIDSTLPEFNNRRAS